MSQRYENVPAAPIGRPSKFRLRYCDTLAADMSEGLSFEACCGKLGISVRTGNNWVQKYPEFADAKELGQAAGQYWWENKAKVNLVLDKECKFNSTVWVFTMKNRFGWRDKREISGSVGIGIGSLGQLYKDLTPAQLESQLQDILSRFPDQLARISGQQPKPAKAAK